MADIDPDSVLRLYLASLEEVRAEVALNDARAGRLMAFTASVLAAGLVLRDSAWAVLPLALGTLCAVLSSASIAISHGYYRRKRDWSVKLAVLLDESYARGLTVRATPGAEGKRAGIRRWLRVQTATHTILAAMALVGAVAAWRAGIS